jgi:SAM-dependent MidA family methyltransferase|tara:strand:+ start:1036 stop:2061 length:1026 start_codon:yes stop_codon:yes gene_type:complete
LINTEFLSFLQDKYQREFFYFDEYMEECLYSDFGFFNTTKVRSNKEGDFLTSPEVSDYFGYFISNFVKVNNIDKNLLEIGAGTGSLGYQIDKFSNKKPLVVEKSKTAITSLEDMQFTVYESVDSMSKEDIGLLYMNEVLDNVPCSIAVNKDGEWFEKIIRLKQDQLVYDLVPAREINLDWISDFNIDALEGIEIEIQKNSTEYLIKLISKFNPEFLIIIDYGYEFHERKDKPYKSLIRTYKNHHLAGDTILQPASTDITYDVNFSSVKTTLNSLNYTVELLTQKEFIEQNGFENLYKKINNEFQVAEGIQKLKLKSDLVGLDAISNNRGLGGFMVAVAKKL